MTSKLTSHLEKGLIEPAKYGSIALLQGKCHAQLEPGRKRVTCRCELRCSDSRGPSPHLCTAVLLRKASLQSTVDNKVQRDISKTLTATLIKMHNVEESTVYKGSTKGAVYEKSRMGIGFLRDELG